MTYRDIADALDDFGLTQSGPAKCKEIEHLANGLIANKTIEESQITQCASRSTGAAFLLQTVSNGKD